MKATAILGLGVTMAVASAAQATVYNGTPHGAIPDSVPAGVSQSILISDPGTVGSLIVSTTWNPGHTWAGDIIMTLSHFDGTNTVTADIMRRVGSATVTGVGDSSDLLGTYRF